MYGGVISEVFERVVCKVDYADIYFGWRGGVRFRVGVVGVGVRVIG